MALCCQVVYLCRAHVCHYAHDRHGVTQVGVMEVEMGPSFKVGYAFTMVYRRAADDAVHVITFVQQEFCQIRTVLSCNARDEGNVLFAHNYNVLLVCYSVVSDDWPRRVRGFGCGGGVLGCRVGWLPVGLDGSFLQIGVAWLQIGLSSGKVGGLLLSAISAGLIHENQPTVCKGNAFS